MIRAVEWIGGRARRQQSRVPREKVLETQISAEVPVAISRACVIERTAANQLERLRSVLPLQRFAVERPQIPLRLHHIRRVLVDVLRRDRRHLRRAKRAFAEVPLRHGRFRCINGLHRQLIEAVAGFRKRSRVQKTHKLRNHGLGRKFPRPQPQICPVCHEGELYRGPVSGVERSAALGRGPVTRRTCRDGGNAPPSSVSWGKVLAADRCGANGPPSLPEGRYSFPAAADLPNSAVISSKRFFSDSPAFANTCEQAARNFSSADAVIPETTSRDW